MSYPQNQAIAYSAVATTTQRPSDTFVYDWVFDDMGSAVGASVAHIWTTSGSHSATVVATDQQIGTSATASKSITVADWSARVWVSTGLKIIAATSPSFGNRASQATRAIVCGDYLVNWQDYYNSTTITTFNTVTNTRNEYTGIMATLGVPAAAYTLDSGPNAGKVLLVGASTRKYAFFDPTTGVLSISPNLTTYTLDGPPTFTAPIAKMGDGKLFLHGYINGPSFHCMAYDQVNDAWSPRSGAGSVIQMSDLFKLPSGNLFGVKDNSTSTYIYNYLSDTWAPGPTLPINYPSGAQIAAQDVNLDIIGVTRGANPKFFRWSEGEASFTLGGNNYPFLSQGGSATGNSWKQFVVSMDGEIVNVGGASSSGSGDVNDTRAVFYYPPNDAWIVGGSYPTVGHVGACAALGGKLWRASSTSGVLQYMVL